MCLSKRGRSCQLCVLCDAKSAFDQGNTIAKMISRQKQKKHSICGKGNRRIQEVVLADVRVLGEVASLRCVSCASSFCLNSLLRLDMTHTDLSPSPAPPITDASTRRPVFLLHRTSGFLGQGPSQRPRGPLHTRLSLLHTLLFQIFDSNF